MYIICLILHFGKEVEGLAFYTFCIQSFIFTYFGGTVGPGSYKWGVKMSPSHPIFFYWQRFNSTMLNFQEFMLYVKKTIYNHKGEHSHFKE